MDLATSAWPVAPIAMEEMWRNVVEGQTIGILKKTRCHLGTIKVPSMENCMSLIGLGLMYPPFWFSTLESKKAMLILLEINIEDHYLRRSCHISSEVSQMISTLDSMACNMEGQVKLIDRLSSPSDQLIHHISDPSKEQTLAKMNTPCFICVQGHSFTACNLHFCKKGFHSVKGPYEVSTQK